jgi:hypothetical protein
VAFLKLGVSKVGCSYSYTQSGVKMYDVDVSTFVPSIGLGFERKFNKKWGVAIEGNISLKQTKKKTQMNIEHKIKMDRKDLRILGTYTLSN